MCIERRTLKMLISSLLLALAVPYAAAHDRIPAREQPGPIVIDGATVHTVSGDSIAAGRVRFEAGRVVAVVPVGTGTSRAGAGVWADIFSAGGGPPEGVPRVSLPSSSSRRRG